MKRGEIWLADLGMTAKVRPVLVISASPNDKERKIVTYIPRTTAIWSESRFDVSHRARGMKDGAFAVQLIGSVPKVKLFRRIAFLDDKQLAEVENTLILWLGLKN